MKGTAAQQTWEGRSKNAEVTYIMIKIAIILGSTRPGRNGEAVAKWVYEVAKKRSDAEFELVDIKDFNLPLLGEPGPPIMGQYSEPHTKRWATKIGEFDAYVFVTPEDSHGISGALKNAIDFLFAEWNNKAAGFVSYGGASGARAVEQLRLNLAEVQMATVRNQVLLSMYSDFENFSVFKPGPQQEKSVNAMRVLVALDILVSSLRGTWDSTRSQSVVDARRKTLRKIWARTSTSILKSMTPQPHCSGWAGPERFLQQPPAVTRWDHLCSAFRPAASSSWSASLRTQSN